MRLTPSRPSPLRPPPQPRACRARSEGGASQRGEGRCKEKEKSCGGRGPLLRCCALRLRKGNANAALRCGAVRCAGQRPCQCERNASAAQRSAAPRHITPRHATPRHATTQQASGCLGAETAEGPASSRNPTSPPPPSTCTPVPSEPMRPATVGNGACNRRQWSLQP